MGRGRVYGSRRVGPKSGGGRQRIGSQPTAAPTSGGTMPTRSARTAWTGGLHDGTGQVERCRSGLVPCDVSFPHRAAEEATVATSPEELVAAAHSACYAMSIAGNIDRAGGTTHAMYVKADVTLGADPAFGV